MCTRWDPLVQAYKGDSSRLAFYKRSVLLNIACHPIKKRWLQKSKPSLLPYLLFKFNSYD